jgi:hypothetical protein
MSKKQKNNSPNGPMHEYLNAITIFIKGEWK